MKIKKLLFLFIFIFGFLLLSSLFTVVYAISTVGTSSDIRIFDNASNRYTFYDATYNYHYVFYTNGSMIGYKSSADGSSWSSFIVVVTETSDMVMFSTWWNGTHVSYAYSDCAGAGSEKIWYCQGTTNSSGLITFGSESTAVGTYAGTTYARVYVFQDSSHFPVVCYLRNKPTPTALQEPWVKKATNTDGSTWGTAVSMNDTDSANWRVMGVPLTNRFYMVIYGRDSDKLKAKLWNQTASAYSSEVTISTSLIQYNTGFSAVAIGDNVYAVFKPSTVHGIKFVNFRV